MGQKVTVDYGVQVNTSKKQKYLDDVQEMFDCCQENNHTRLAQLLLENENLSRCTGRKARTPLHAAAQFGCVEIISTLLEQGADINALDYVSLTSEKRELLNNNRIAGE